MPKPKHTVAEKREESNLMGLKVTNKQCRPANGGDGSQSHCVILEGNLIIQFGELVRLHNGTPSGYCCYEMKRHEDLFIYSCGQIRKPLMWIHMTIPKQNFHKIKHRNLCLIDSLLQEKISGIGRV